MATLDEAIQTEQENRSVSPELAVPFPKRISVSAQLVRARLSTWGSNLIGLSKSHLALRLILPLLLIVGTTFVLHWRLGWDGFFLNLATELIGIIITVVYVDWAVRRNEEAKWFRVRSRIETELKTIAKKGLNEIRNSLGYGDDFTFRYTLVKLSEYAEAHPEEAERLKGDVVGMHPMMARVFLDASVQYSEEIVEPAVPQVVTDGTVPTLFPLNQALGSLGSEVSGFIRLYSAQITPDEYENLSEIEAACLRGNHSFQNLESEYLALLERQQSRSLWSRLLLLLRSARNRSKSEDELVAEEIAGHMAEAYEGIGKDEMIGSTLSVLKSLRSLNAKVPNARIPVRRNV